MKIIAQNTPTNLKYNHKLEKSHFSSRISAVTLSTEPVQTSISFKSLLKKMTTTKSFGFKEVIKQIQGSIKKLLFASTHKNDTAALEALEINKLLEAKGYPHGFLVNILDAKHLKNKNLLDDLDKYKAYISEFGVAMLIACYDNNYSLDELEAIKKEILATASDIKFDVKTYVEKNLFFHVENTIQTIKILGKDNFIKLAKDKIGDLENIINLSAPASIDVDWKTLINLLQLEQNDDYKAIEQKIAALKKDFKIDGDNTDTVNKIKELSKQKNEILAKKIKDSNEAYSIALLYKNLFIYNKQCLDEIFPLLGSKKIEDIDKVRQILNKYIFKFLDVKYSNLEIEKIFNFSNSKYIDKLFTSDEGFREGLKELIETIDKNYSESLVSTLENLPQNIATKQHFKKIGLSYDKWVSALDGVFTECRTATDINKIVHNILKNIEMEFNALLNSSIPEEEKQVFVNALKEKGFTFVKTSTAEYNEYGGYSGISAVTKIYKNGKALDLEGAKQFIERFVSIIERDFWRNKNKDLVVENNRITILDHICERLADEIRRASSKTNISKFNDIVIQKVNMNDIPKSLFLGNDSACCTATDGCNAWTSSAYILNKCIQAIEFKKGDTSIGNTMCFVAHVNGNLSLILDNIEVKSEFQYSEELRNAIIDFAKKLCAELGKPNMSIYVGKNRHKVEFGDFPVIKNCTIKPIGTTKGFVYLDSIDGANELAPNKLKYASIIIKIKG